MSLKAFHIVFIAAAFLLAVFFCGWAVHQYQSGEGSLLELILGIVSWVLAVGLICYGRYFLRKLKDVSYL